MINSDVLVAAIKNTDLIGTPYDQLDCQALVEKILKKAGYTYNWRGSNHMWRDAVYDRQKITDPNQVTAGEAVFTIKNDGGEIERGYHDNYGNAAHVGLYAGDGWVLHSTNGGVQWSKITDKRWTHHAKWLCVDYVDKIVENVENLTNQIDYDTIIELLQQYKKEGRKIQCYLIG